LLLSNPNHTPEKRLSRVKAILRWQLKRLKHSVKNNEDSHQQHDEDGF
jgi:hypothetical protein